MKVTLFRDLPSERWFSMERYADELYAALKALGCEVRTYVAARPWPRLQGPAGAWLNHLWRLAIYPLAARQAQGEVNHILDHCYGHLLHTLDPQRTVVTCHDIAPQVLEHTGHNLSYRLWQVAFHALPKATQILSDSAHTRAELLAQTTIPPERITVVPLGVRATPPGTRPINAQGSPFILHVGSCQPRKNLAVLLRALARVPTARLVQVGGQADAKLKELIDKLGLRPRIQWMGQVSEANLQQWYRAASVLVFPSFYEGFGLPVLEAMAAGVPVICSNATSLPEVAGEAALLFDPQDADTLAAHLQQVLGDAALRQQMIEAGYTQSRLFTWERTARATLAVYERVGREQVRSKP